MIPDLRGIMSTVHTVTVCDEHELSATLIPRDDVLVLEQRGPTNDGQASFELAHGPFVRYRRTVAWSPRDGDDGDYDVDQTVDYRLAIPYWAVLYNPVVRRALPRGVTPGTRPWWSTPNRLGANQSTMVAAMAMFNLVAGLLYGLLTQVLTFIAADLGDGSRSQQTDLLAVVRLGVVFTMAAMVVADRIGRRRVALTCFTASGLLTVLTAVSPSLWAVGGLQLVSRSLAIAGLLCVDTIAVEELPAGSRAMVTGLGTLAYGLGAGIIVMTLPLADVGDWGWRLTFLVAGVSLPMIWSAARHLPESGRFVRVAAQRRADADLPPGDVPSVADDLPVESRRIHGGRFVLLGAMFLLFNVFVAPSSQLQNDYLRTERGFSGLLITVFVLATGTPAGLGVLAGGRLADIRGRKAAIIPGLIAIGVFNAIFFSIAGVPMWFGSLLGSVLGGLAVPALGVIAPELFPTARRGSVRGALTAIAVGGSVCGLLIAGPMIDAHGYGPTFTILAVAPLIAAALALAIPETRGRELEEINR